MSNYYSRRNIDFLLKEVFNTKSLFELELFNNHSKESIKMVLDAADALSQKELYPYLSAMDREKPKLDNGHVRVHAQVRQVMKSFGEGGWISATSLMKNGGQQLPSIVANCAQFIFGAANFSASVFPTLTAGASHIIESYGSEYLKETYLPKLQRGTWQGTMAMTEPEAGSSLSDIRTIAELIDVQNGIFSIQGEKIFISAGDHDGVGNIVHLVLARIKDAPQGINGLSLFVVPQKRVDKEDQITFNDIQVSSLFEKMGYKGAPAVSLVFGLKKKCLGHIVGKPGQGIEIMFELMNEARIGVGLGATSIASAAYYHSLAYAKERKQGRLPDNKDAESSPVELVKHADVKRMLLSQKAMVEGSLSLLLQCSFYADMARAGREEVKEIYRLTLDLLTPVAKSFPSEAGVASVGQAIQILAGAGYCQDHPVEQYFRDMKIHSIHEGTSGIHAIDLLGRKIVMGGGIAFRAFTEEVSKTIKVTKLEVTELSKYGERLNDVLFRLQNTTMRLSTLAMKEKKEVYLMDATLYLELFGIVAIAWQWLLQAIPCQIAINENRQDAFYESKLYTMRYFYEYELPKAEAIITRLNSADKITLQLSEKHLL